MLNSFLTQYVLKFEIDPFSYQIFSHYSSEFTDSLYIVIS